MLPPKTQNSEANYIIYLVLPLFLDLVVLNIADDCHCPFHPISLVADEAPPVVARLIVFHKSLQSRRKMLFWCGAACAGDAL
jgi:hypothetical protein